MAFELIKAEIAQLVAQLADKPEDSEELEFLLHERLGQMKAFGMPLPEDLVLLEAMLDELLAERARERSKPVDGGT